MKKIDGELIVNAATPLRVEITKRDIEDGSPLNPNSCAIAVACKRHVKGVTDAYVHLGRLYLLINGKWRRWHVPQYATYEVVAFDRGGKFVPQEIVFTPPPPEQLMKRIKRKSSRAASSSGPRRKRVVHRTPDVRHSAHADLPERK